MERIKSLQQLRMQKELLQLQQMITELRIKKEVTTIKKRFRPSANLVPIATTIWRNGLKNNLERGVLGTVMKQVGKFIKKSKKRRKPACR
jgi:hypothetical protein